jgi:uncharacterized protein with PQ loop repeat
MSATLPVLAGITSTVVFAFSTVPMLVKAGRTKDMSSYSLGNIVLVNVGNVVHSVYVFHLPVGPIWALHVFYLVSSAVQLTWYLRYLPRTRAGPSNVALRRVRVGTSGYSPTNSVRALSTTQRRKDPVTGSASPSPHRRQACRRAVRRGEDQAGTGDAGRVERERPAARRADQQLRPGVAGGGARRAPLIRGRSPS